MEVSPDEGALVEPKVPHQHSQPKPRFEAALFPLIIDLLWHYLR
jgi:hypothetical protein